MEESRHGSSESPRRHLVEGVLQTSLESDERSIVLVEESGEEIRRATAVNDGGADDIAPLAQREAARDAVIDHTLTVAYRPSAIAAWDLLRRIGRRRLVSI